MAKVKSKYVCQSCGYETAGYLGKCPECGSWGTFVEETDIPVIKDVQIPDNCPPMKLNEIEMNSEIRMSTNISEFDRVLGSGIVQGSLILYRHQVNFVKTIKKFCMFQQKNLPVK